MKNTKPYVINLAVTIHEASDLEAVQRSLDISKEIRQAYRTKASIMEIIEPGKETIKARKLQLAPLLHQLLTLNN